MKPDLENGQVVRLYLTSEGKLEIISAVIVGEDCNNCIAAYHRDQKIHVILDVAHEEGRKNKPLTGSKVVNLNSPSISWKKYGTSILEILNLVGDKLPVM